MTIKAEATEHEGKILVRTSFGHNEFEKAKDQSKSIAGARWSAKFKAWSYPLTVDVCHALRQVYGENLSVHPRLGKWYIEGQQQREGQTQKAAQTDAKLETLPTSAPALFAALRADQRAGSAWVATAYRGGCLVADQPGCGKTLVTIAGILEADVRGPILVACPRLSVKAVWWRELKRWTNEAVYMARGTRAQREKAIGQFMADPSERKWLIITSEMLRAKVETNEETNRRKVVGFEYPELQRRWGTVVVDESHKAFGSLTITKGNLMGLGLKEVGKLTDRRIAISGTPFGKGGRVQGMFGSLHWLWPDEFTSFWRWAGTHFVIEEEDVYIPGGRGRTRTVRRVAGLKAGLDEEQFLHSLGPRILRRTKEEVLPWLPPKQYVNMWCEMTPAQRKQYERLTADGEIVTDGGLITADGVLAGITRAKQLANGSVTADAEGRVRFTDESCKIDMLMQKIEDHGITDGTTDLKIIVASQFNEFLEAVGRRLEASKVEYLLMTGKTSDRQRDLMMEQFQAEGGPQVFMLNSKAGGVSVTLDAADEVHALDELWDPGDNEQLEDRVHRASRNHQVTIYRYLTEGTVDEQIERDVEGKRFEQFKALDGRRGREYLRNLTQFRKDQS